MPERVESVEVEGVDYGWVMQVTFVTTIVVGAPIVAALSAFVTLPTWTAMATFAVRVGAVVWFLTAVGAYLYARRLVEEGPVEDAADLADDGSTTTDLESDAVPEGDRGGDAGVGADADVDADADG